VNAFVAAHEADVMGVLEGWDRVVFRGTLRSISYPQGMGAFAGSLKVLYKDYSAFAQGLSDRLKRHAREVARRAGRPFEYVASPSACKERIARRIAERDGVVSFAGWVEVLAGAGIFDQLGGRSVVHLRLAPLLTGGRLRIGAR